jgi:hypothetical protein
MGELQAQAEDGEIDKIRAPATLDKIVRPPRSSAPRGGKLDRAEQAVALRVRDRDAHCAAALPGVLQRVRRHVLRRGVRPRRWCIGRVVQT